MKKAASLRQLCRWFEVPRRTVYYQAVKAKPKVDAQFAEPIKAMIEENPSFGYRTVAHPLGFNKNSRHYTGLVRSYGLR